MKILIDIPKAFEVDYNTDRFAEFFQRCLADIWRNPLVQEFPKELLR